MLAFSRNQLFFKSGFLHYMFASSKFQTYKDVKIPNSEMSKNFMRSSGPGGQSVNTTNSKAEIRILIKGSSIIDQFIANNLQQKYPNFINKQGQLFVRSQVHKSQNANVAECVIKLQKLIFNCSQVPEQRKYDIPPETEEQEEARIEQKRWRGDIKKLRRKDKRYT